MQQAHNNSKAHPTSHTVVVGAGPVGLRLVQEVLKREPMRHITLIGDEASYNRVQLSALLAKEVDLEQVVYELPSSETYPNFRFVHAQIKQIKPLHKTVVDHLEQQYPYDQLVLATGSRSFVPSIEGAQLKRVYVFRNLKDTESLAARLASSRKVVVIGGGLLGLEAANAMRQANTEVTLVQQGPHLMNRQLDPQAAARLQQRMEQRGIKFVINNGVRRIIGHSQVEGVLTRDGQELEADTVIFCAGIQANTQLAKEARLKVTKGVLVNQYLQSSDPNIYAVGECSEFEGKCYGLVAPGFEQAAVAAEHLCANADTVIKAAYSGSTLVSRLKVAGEAVFSMGDIDKAEQHPLAKSYCFEDQDHYRRIVLLRGKLLAAIGIGPWPEFQRIQEAITSQRKLNLVQAWRFKQHGALWQEQGRISDWPADAIICQCNQLSQGQLCQAIAEGCNKLELLQQETKASTVCGSCKPIVTELLSEQTGEVSKAQPEKHSTWLAWLSGLSALVALLVLLYPPLQAADSVQQAWRFDLLWNDGFYKQVTGFSLLGLSAFGLIMSLRKRMGWTWLGSFANWRLTHVVLGVACVSLMIVHTGFHLGENLNRLLAMNFLLILGMGALTGATIALSHKLSGTQALKLRKFWSWGHILVSWPLPILLIVHIISVYYF